MQRSGPKGFDSDNETVVDHERLLIMKENQTELLGLVDETIPTDRISKQTGNFVQERSKYSHARMIKKHPAED